MSADLIRTMDEDIVHHLQHWRRNCELPVKRQPGQNTPHSMALRSAGIRSKLWFELQQGLCRPHRLYCYKTRQTHQAADFEHEDQPLQVPPPLPLPCRLRRPHLLQGDYARGRIRACPSAEQGIGTPTGLAVQSYDMIGTDLQPSVWHGFKLFVKVHAKRPQPPDQPKSPEGGGGRNAANLHEIKWGERI